MFPPRPRRPRAPEPLVGSGSLLVTGTPADQGGPGQSIVDTRRRGIAARVTGHPDASTNAYAFVRVDEGRPATFPTLTGDAAIAGDGVALAAYELSGRADVPADGSAVVRLFPLVVGAGYGFTYTGAAANPPVFNFLAAQFTMARSGALEDTGLTLALPAAGSYLLSARVSIAAALASLPGSLVSVEVYADGGADGLLFPVFNGQPAHGLLCGPVTGVTLYASQHFARPTVYTVTGPRTLRLWAAAGASWSSAALTTYLQTPGPTWLAYQRLGGSAPGGSDPGGAAPGGADGFTGTVP